jgi:hypothetical protein
MKPRLNAPLTQEDLDIWVSVGHLVRPSRKHFGDVLSGVACDADRRDADLMWLIERVRITTRGARPTTYPKWPMVMILIRGDAAMGLSWPNGEPL